MNKVNSRRTGKTIFDVLMLALALFLLWRAYLISGFSSPSSPGALPMIAALVMAASVLYVLVADGVKDKRASTLEAAPPRQEAQSRRYTVYLPLFFFISIVFYAVLFERLGFLLTSLLFLIVTIKVMHRGSLKQAVTISFVSLALIYIVFRLTFKVVLPEGVVPEREIIAFITAFFR